jgi:hypothetical protein
MKKNPSFTVGETALAKRLFAEAEANGTLKAPQAIAAVGSRSGGLINTVRRSQVTFRDYLRVARTLLRPNKRSA